LKTQGAVQNICTILLLHQPIKTHVIELKLHWAKGQNLRYYHNSGFAVD